MTATPAPPTVCDHGTPLTTITRMFAWYEDGCAITPAAIRRGERPTPRTIITAR